MIDYLVFYPLEFISRIVTSWYWRRLAQLRVNSLACLEKSVRIERRRS